MHSIKDTILTINGGSSSIKVAMYELGALTKPVLRGQVERIGTPNAILSFTGMESDDNGSSRTKALDQEDAAAFLIDWLGSLPSFGSVKAIGHRIVHGMSYTAPQQITDKLLDELKAISSYDPEHLPEEIRLIEQFRKRCPALPQIACFDTSFHASMPDVAKLLPIPRRYGAMGIRRYGFHGLSYTYLMEELEKTSGEEAAKGRIILAHLGSGASLAAVKDGKSMDTSMGFTPAAGLPMGTRSGDLDPGVASYLIQTHGLSPVQFGHLINHESGMMGVSETSADMRELLQSESTDLRAAEAIELFCYQTRKWIGSFAAVLGGLDTLVFSGGIGENAPQIRERICRGLQFLGIEIDEARNANNEKMISTGASRVSVQVIPTDEEMIIARSVSQMLHEIKN